MQVFAKQPKPSDFIEEQPTCKKVKTTDTPGDAVLATLLRSLEMITLSVLPIISALHLRTNQENPI